MVTTHFTHENFCGMLFRFRATVPGGKGIVPTMEFLVPSFKELEFVVSLSLSENTNGCIGELKLFVDTNQVLDGVWTAIRNILGFFVVQGLGVSMTATGVGA